MNEPPGVWAPGRRLLSVALVASVVLVGSETLAIATVMPAVAADLGLGGYGLAFSLFFVGSIVGVLLAGPAGERSGPLWPFAVGMGFFAAGLGVGAAAGSIEVLVAGRLLQGLGAGAIPAVSYACIGQAYPEHDHPRMLAVLSTAWILPGMVGPGLAGFVAEYAGWRWVFGGLLPLVGVVLLVAVRPLRALTPSEPVAGAVRPVLPLLDAVRLAAGIGLIIGGVGRLGGRSPVAFAVAAALAVAGVVCAAGPSGRLLPGGWWRARAGIAAVVVVRSLVAYAFIAAEAFVPLMLTEVRGRSLAFASLAVSLSALLWSAGSWIAERMVGSYGAARLAGVGAGVVTFGVLWQLLLLAPGVPVAPALAGVAVAALGMGLAFTPLAVLVLDAPGPSGGAVASSWMALFEQLGFATGPILGGLMVASSPSSPGLGRGLAVSLVVAAAVGALAVLLRQRLSATEIDGLGQ